MATINDVYIVRVGGHDDYDCVCDIRNRKTRADILTPADAMKSRKSSKSHKLKPRSVKRDRTKTTESKTATKNKNRTSAYVSHVSP